MLSSWLRECVCSGIKETNYCTSSHSLTLLTPPTSVPLKSCFRKINREANKFTEYILSLKVMTIKFGISTIKQRLANNFVFEYCLIRITSYLYLFSAKLSRQNDILIHVCSMFLVKILFVFVFNGFQSLNNIRIRIRLGKNQKYC